MEQYQENASDHCEAERVPIDCPTCGVGELAVMAAMTEFSSDAVAESLEAVAEADADEFGYVVVYEKHGDEQSVKDVITPELEVNFKWGKTRLTAELAQRASTRARIITATSGK